MEEWLDFSEFLEKTQEYLDLGLYNEARGMLDQYDDIFNDEWEYHFIYSRVFAEQNHPEQAIPCLHRGLHLDRTNADCLLGLFYAYAMMNKVKKGGRYLLRAEKYHSDNEMVLSALIWYYSEINNYDKAISYFERARKIGISNPETFRNAGLAFERSGQFDSAEQCFLTALEMNSQFEEVRDLLADHYLFAEDTQKAIRLYQEALKESPNHIRLMSRLIFCFTQDGQTEQAETLAKDSIHLYPNSPVGYVDLAYVCLAEKNYEQSIISSNKALDISPIDSEAFRVKGIAFSEMGKDNDAQNAFETAMSLDPENPEILRDYYHFLRDIGESQKMEELINKVVGMEYPYCIEDYWFLADFCRENGQNLKAFHYLHKAYKTMPGEKELLPPMIDILLEEGHLRFSLPFLARYAEKSGWNDIMNQFAKHKRLKGKWAQEGIRLLRYRSQKPFEYHNFVFMLYLQRFIILSGGMIFLLLLLPSYLLFRLQGMIILGSLFAAMIGSYYLTRLFIRRTTKPFAITLDASL